MPRHYMSKFSNDPFVVSNHYLPQPMQPTEVVATGSDI